MRVVVLISITVTFVNLNLQPDSEKLVLREAERIAALIRQLKDESILRGRALAFEFDEFDQEYRFSGISDGEWQPLEGDDLFRLRAVLQPVKAVLDVRGASEKPAEDEGEEELSESEKERLKADRYRIVVDPAGTVTPFEMILAAENHRVMVGLDSYDDVTVTPVPDE